MPDRVPTPVICPWPRVVPGDAASETEWRARFEERVDEMSRAQRAIWSELRGLRAEVRTEVREAARSSTKIPEACMALVGRIVDLGAGGAGRLLSGILHPTIGTITLAGMATVIVLALIGWSAVDMLTLVERVPVRPEAP